MRKTKDLSGQVFNHFTVIRIAGFRNHRSYWVCRCECGKEIMVKGSILTRKINPQKSCMECFRKRSTLHGMTNTKEFFAWRGILSRCNNKNDDAYRHYGGRGIGYDPRWNEFKCFFEDIGPAPSKRHSIDRTDNNEGYFKWNCRWATPKQQMRNVRPNIILEYNGEKRCLPEWAELMGLSYACLSNRIRRGWAVEKALTELPKLKTKAA